MKLDWPMFVALVAGGGVGALVGTPVAQALAGRAKQARLVFAVMVIAAAGYVAWRAIL